MQQKWEFLRIPLLSLFIIPFHRLGMFKFLKNLTSRKLLWGTLKFKACQAQLCRVRSLYFVSFSGSSSPLKLTSDEKQWMQKPAIRRLFFRGKRGKSSSSPRQKGNEGYLIAGFWEFNTIEPRKRIARKRRKLQSFFTLTWFVDCLLFTHVYLIRRLVHFKYRILTLQIPHFRVLFCFYF